TKHIKMTLAEEITFLNKAAVKKALYEIPDGAELTIDMRNVYAIQHDVKEIINEFENSAEERNITVNFITQNEEENKEQIENTYSREFSK
ncbi:MAG: SulP family inorganic anion transporter, partial [Flavobacteriales bacterium]